MMFADVIVYKYQTLFSSWRNSFLDVTISKCYNLKTWTLLVGTFLLPRLCVLYASADPLGDCPLQWWQGHLAWDTIDDSLHSDFKFVWPWLILINILHFRISPPLSLFLPFVLLPLLGFQKLVFYIISPTIPSYFTPSFPLRVLIMASKHILWHANSASLTFWKYFKQDLLKILL